MDTHDKAAVINRLKTINGHLNGVIAMVEQDRYCIEVMKQVQAIQAALSKVNTLMLDHHLNHCVITAIQGEDTAERQRVLAEISDLFVASGS
jgi:CsoR family transcriptional regulator, copper-sensing transcriptional repressor